MHCVSGKSLKITVHLHCLIPTEMGPIYWVLRTHCCYTVSFSFKFKVFWYKFTKRGSRKFSGFSFTANLTGSFRSWVSTRLSEGHKGMISCFFPQRWWDISAKIGDTWKKTHISLLTITSHVFFFHGECCINLHLPTVNRASGKFPDCNLFRAPRAPRCKPCLLWDVV